MSESIRDRLNRLKSRKRTGEDSAADLQTAAASAVAAHTSTTDSSNSLSTTTAASTLVKNLPPSFKSPSSAVVKYRDNVRDPLCVGFTTRDAVRLFRRVVQTTQCEEGQRQNCTTDTESAAIKMSPHESLDQGASNRMDQDINEENGPRVTENGESEKKEISDDQTEKEEKCTPNSSSEDLVVSYHLSAVTKGCLGRSLELAKGCEPMNRETPFRSLQGNFEGRHKEDSFDHSQRECILVTGKCSPPCPSIDKYLNERRIAGGVYGVVYRAVRNTSGECSEGRDVKQAQKKYAVKQVKGNWIRDSEVGFPPYLLREFDLLLRIRHPNIIAGREVLILDKRHRGGGGGAKSSLSDTHGGGGSASSGTEGVTKPGPDAHGETLKESTGIVSSTSVIAPNAGNDRRDGTSQSVQSGANQMKDVYLVMDYCPYDLKTFLCRRDERGVYMHLSSSNLHPNAPRNFLSRVKCVMQQLFRGLDFLHAHRILHRDIKTSNILISNEGIVKLCDFGLGRLYREGERLTANVVTLMYRAPELHFGICDYTHEMDVWSLGCVMAELFLKLPLFQADGEAKHFASICDIIGIPEEKTFSGLYKLPAATSFMRGLTNYNREDVLEKVFKKSKHAGALHIPQSGLDLLRKIFRWNPIDRISARDALNEKFFHEDPLPCEPVELLRPMPSSTQVPTGGWDNKTDPQRRNEMDYVGATPPPRVSFVQSKGRSDAGEGRVESPAMRAGTRKRTRTAGDNESEKEAATAKDGVATLQEEAELMLDSLTYFPSPENEEGARRVAPQTHAQDSRDLEFVSASQVTVEEEEDDGAKMKKEEAP